MTTDKQTRAGLVVPVEELEKLVKLTTFNTSALAAHVSAWATDILAAPSAPSPTVAGLIAEAIEALKRCRFDSLNMSLEDMRFCTAVLTKLQAAPSLPAGEEPSLLRWAGHILQLFDDATSAADYMIDANDAEGILNALAEYTERFGVPSDSAETREPTCWRAQFVDTDGPAGPWHIINQCDVAYHRAEGYEVQALYAAPAATRAQGATTEHCEALENRLRERYGLKCQQAEQTFYSFGKHPLIAEAVAILAAPAPGPKTELDDTKVICPSCVHQFKALSVKDQQAVSAMRATINAQAEKIAAMEQGAQAGDALEPEVEKQLGEDGYCLGCECRVDGVDPCLWADKEERARAAMSREQPKGGE